MREFYLAMLPLPFFFIIQGQYAEHSDPGRDADVNQARFRRMYLHMCPRPVSSNPVPLPMQACIAPEGVIVGLVCASAETCHAHGMYMTEMTTQLCSPERHMHAFAAWPT